MAEGSSHGAEQATPLGNPLAWRTQRLFSPTAWEGEIPNVWSSPSDVSPDRGEPPPPYRCENGSNFGAFGLLREETLILKNGPHSPPP